MFLAGISIPPGRGSSKIGLPLSPDCLVLSGRLSKMSMCACPRQFKMTPSALCFGAPSRLPCPLQEDRNDANEQLVPQKLSGQKGLC